MVDQLRYVLDIAEVGAYLLEIEFDHKVLNSSQILLFVSDEHRFEFGKYLDRKLQGYQVNYLSSGETIKVNYLSSGETIKVSKL